MFEIGSTLREARVRRKLTLQQVEEDTKIRVKYLQAMENEDFDLMPGAAYAKGFLQTYAQYLGLDAQIILDEYRSRGLYGEEPQPFAGASVIGKPHAHRRRNTLAFVAVACLLLLGVIYALGLNSDEPTGAAGGGGLPAVLSPSPSPTPSPTRTARPSPTPTVGPDVVRVSTVAGDCWLEVRRSGSTGTVLFSGTVPRGKTRVFRGDDLWLRIGNPAALKIRVGARVMPALEGSGPLIVTIKDGTLTQTP